MGRARMTLKDSWSKVNVVCVTYNNEDTIGPLLSNLFEHRKLIAEVVVHDNGSADDTVNKFDEWVAKNRGFPATIIRAENVGFGAGIYGACTALDDGDLPTLCLNPDAILSTGTLEQLVRALNADPSLGIVTAPLIRADGELDSASIRKLPRFGPSVAYSMLGKLVPDRFRYNSTRIDDLKRGLPGRSEAGFTTIEATTGALMLVNPRFRKATHPIFDLSYWMYGEDLQLCKDAADEGFKVAIIDWPPSLHLKGVSSGWPRGRTSNRAFHDALLLYYSKNMSSGPIDRSIARIAVATKYLLSETSGTLVRQAKAITRS